MSDSDDTDYLLLIPPDFFLSVTFSDQEANEYSFEDITEMSAAKWDFDTKAKGGNNYQFLPPNQQAELDNINARLANIETHFSPPSDLSTISNGTVRTAPEGRVRNSALRTVTHSTPKDPLRNDGRNTQEYHGVLKEIDNFLEDQKYKSVWNGNATRAEEKTEEQAISLPIELNHNQMRRVSERGIHNGEPIADRNLVSLSEMWSKNAPGDLTLKEERYRRLHLEKTVRNLQSKLLEYQQRISVALEVDKSKDNAIYSAQEENRRFRQENQTLKEELRRFEGEHRELGNKYEIIQKELAQALGLAAKFQDKNEKLESELQSFTRKNVECSSFYKAQIEELEQKLHASKKSEETLSNELSKVKDHLVKAEYHGDKAIAKSEDLEKQLESLKHHKEQAQELLQKQKNRADQLEEQKKSLSEKLASLTEKEATLQKKLESQRQGLKLHYQQQLENVVAQKLKEFQEQLDKVEETLKQDARDRERLIAERAIKQMELINEKNEQELNLLQERHKEEVELYRIQLANSSKKIDELEAKLSSYKTKRADIAEKLHSVMEAQWQKALEILTSPSAHTSGNSTTMENVQSTAENEQFETPKTSRHNRTEDMPHMDKLQAYIELLLSKSPQDIENLQDLFTKTKLSPSTSKSKSQQRSVSGKPPWKA